MGQENSEQENNGQGEAFQPAKWLFFGAVLLALILSFSVGVLYILADPTPAPPPEQTTEEPVLPTNSEVAIEETQAPPTDPSSLSTPIVIIDITVEDWQIERSKCVNITRSWVKLLGLEIMGGVPPYKLRIEQKGELVYENVVDIVPESQPTKIVFSSPITVNTGSFINVTINSNTNDGKPIWQDRLFFYYFDPMCLGDTD